MRASLAVLAVLAPFAALAVALALVAPACTDGWCPGALREATAYLAGLALLAVGAWALARRRLAASTWRAIATGWLAALGAGALVVAASQALERDAANGVVALAVAALAWGAAWLAARGGGAPRRAKA